MSDVVGNPDTTDKLDLFELEYPALLREREAKLLHRRRQMVGDGYDGSASKIAAQIGQAADDRVGIALSGGGIRSATFCLGLFQALAKHKLLGKVDFLSTVSGGGYFGGFLGALFTRDWIRDAPKGKQPPSMPPGDGRLGGVAPGVSRVEEVLSRTHSWCLRYLRESGRYINPTGSGDWWLAAAMFMRNWVSMLVVLWSLAVAGFALLSTVRFVVVPALASLPFLPGMDGLEAALAEQIFMNAWWSPWVLLAAGVFLVVSLPMGIAYWSTQDVWSHWKRPFDVVQRRLPQLAPGLVGIACVGLLIVGDDLEILDDSGWIVWLLLFQTVLALVYWLMAVGRQWNSTDPRYGSRNRLARGLARSLRWSLVIVAVAWIDALGQSFHAAQSFEVAGQSVGWWTTLTTVIGLTTVAAFGQRITALFDSLPKLKMLKVPTHALATLAGAALLVLFLGSASYCVHLTVWDGKQPAVATGSSTPGQEFVLPGGLIREAGAGSFRDLQPLLRDTDWTARPAPQGTQLLVLLAAAAFFAWMVGQTFAFFNLSSLHSFYSARLSRAYLGASNPQRFGANPGVGTPSRGDDVAWEQYRPWEAGGPVHLVNQTVNQTTGGTSRVQYRDRKGQILSVGAAGASVGRHDHGLWEYDDKGHSALRDHPRLRNFVPLQPLNVRPEHFHSFGVPPKGRAGSSLADHALLERRTLGRNVAISGAAFTTGIGTRTHLGTSLLAGLFNVRLGYWWSVEIDRSKYEGDPHNPRPESWGMRALDRIFHVQARLIGELMGRFHGARSHRWYLSDGGHFENTAAYELIRRRVPFIIVCDCGQDRDYGFADLSTLTRQVRIDFGAQLTVLTREQMGDIDVHPDIRLMMGATERFAVPIADDDARAKAFRRSHAHALLARVDYPKLRPTDAKPPPSSYLLFIKPSLTGDEPQDVLHYQATHRDFPNETTLDQNFDEAQWESYRALGLHIGERLFADAGGQHGRTDWWQPRHMTRPQ